MRPSRRDAVLNAGGGRRGKGRHRGRCCRGHRPADSPATAAVAAAAAIPTVNHERPFPPADVAGHPPTAGAAARCGAARVVVVVAVVIVAAALSALASRPISRRLLAAAVIVVAATAPAAAAPATAIPTSPSSPFVLSDAGGSTGRDMP